jgi:hypothetical protein
MKLKIIKHLIRYIFRRWPYLMMDVVIPDGSHIQRDWNWKRKGARG